ncbi:hypothetical protein HanIR_Chr02g0051261 [Helianthus annuus]|nr:hypothetical protein HanIR_Chr02g0051261 [Helianthus annuus]
MMRIMTLKFLVVLVLMIWYQGGKHESINIKPFGVPSPKQCISRCVKTNYGLKYCCAGVEEIHCCIQNEALCNRDCPSLQTCCPHK